MFEYNQGWKYAIDEVTNLGMTNVRSRFYSDGRFPSSRIQTICVLRSSIIECNLASTSGTVNLVRRTCPLVSDRPL